MARRRKKNHISAYVAIAIIGIAAAAFWHFFLKTETAESPAQENKPPDAVTTEVETKTDAAAGKKLYSMAELSGEVKSKIADKMLAISPAYKELAAENIGPAAGGADDLTDLARQTANDYSFAFDYQGKRYIVTADYSGGAHCCFAWYAFILDPQNNLNSVPASADIAGMGNVYPEGERNLVQKNGNLYLALSDDRFSYYCGTYSESPIVMRYFLITPDKLILKNDDFREEFSAAAQNDETALKDYYNSQKTAGDQETKAARCRYLVERSANFLLAGESGLAWNDFSSLYKKVAPLEPCSMETGVCVTEAQFKKDIAEYLNK